MDARRALIYCDIIIEGKGWISGEIVIAADQGQGVGVTSDDTGCDLHPDGIVITRPGKNRSGRPGGIIPQGRRRPVELHGVGAVHLVPEAERSGPTGRRKGLPD